MEHIILEDSVQSPTKRKKHDNDNTDIYIKNKDYNDITTTTVSTHVNGVVIHDENKSPPNHTQQTPTDKNEEQINNNNNNHSSITNGNVNTPSTTENDNNNNNNNSATLLNNVLKEEVQSNTLTTKTVATPAPPPIVVNSVVLYSLKDITNRISKDFKELSNFMQTCCPLLYAHSGVGDAQSIVEKLHSIVMSSLESLQKNQTPHQNQPQYQTYQPQPYQYPNSYQQQSQQQQQPQTQQIQQQNSNNNNLQLQQPSFSTLYQNIYSPIVQQQNQLQQKVNENPTIQNTMYTMNQQLQQQPYTNPYIIPSPVIPNQHQQYNVNNLVNHHLYKQQMQQIYQQQQIQQQQQQQQQLQQVIPLQPQPQPQPQPQSQQLIPQQQVLQHQLQSKAIQQQQQQALQQIYQNNKTMILNNLINSLNQQVNIDFSKTLLTDYQLLDELGTGSFAKVRLCRHIESNKLFCMKILNQNKIIRLRQEIHVCNEKEILLLVDHPFIVKLYATYKDNRDLFFLQEFVPCGELFDYIRTHGSLSAKVTKLCAAEIILALEYLHSQDIIYRDLKPENILIDQFGHIKLTDFGFAKQIKENTKSMCGTPEYIAPEILSGHGHGKSVDWWSLGILIYEMLVGVPPFISNEGNQHDIFKMIREGKIIIPPDIGDTSRDIIEKLVVVDVEKRLGSLEGGVEDIKNHPFFQDIDWQRVQSRDIPPLEPIFKPLKHYPTMLDDDRYIDDDNLATSHIKPEILDKRKNEFFSNF
ncbi:cAMP-dependent protein kinase [Tieghemostelium lacteum]|uniref:cAMP-dependent protein kinase n=1 Tax=Tieghemostelium lacteum TaxID=361077 RepID=A0A151ZJD8_TIELA|nr:cAMP-dependent protein kinase [Tieghemostelium lacteum]|eukprot:KYQ93924.1 cAMP-dependent protein kinase [Tieghemostelium lacteum]